MNKDKAKARAIAASNIMGINAWCAIPGYWYGVYAEHACYRAEGSNPIHTVVNDWVKTEFPGKTVYIGNTPPMLPPYGQSADHFMTMRDVVLRKSFIAALMSAKLRGEL